MSEGRPPRRQAAIKAEQILQKRVAEDVKDTQSVEDQDISSSFEESKET